MNSENNNYNESQGKLRRIWKKLFKFTACALIFGMIAGIGFQAVNYSISFVNSNRVSSVTKSSVVQTSTASTSAVASDVSSVAKEAMPSLVSITQKNTTTVRDRFGRQGTYESESCGSGIIVGESSKELYIVSNYHVISGSGSISITFIDGTSADAQIKGTDENIDIAVLEVPLSEISSSTKSSIKIAVLGNSESLVVGEPAIAIGNALGYGQSVTAGVISALNRKITVNNVTNVLIQTDAAINPGNSGGALLNIKGEVIGINQLKFASSDVEGMGYAIPISTVIPVINRLMNDASATTSSNSYKIAS